VKRRSAWISLSALLALGLLTGAAFAADKTAKSTKANDAKSEAPKTDAQHDQMMEMMMKASMPGPMHDLMKPMAGNWKTTAKSWMKPGGEPEVSEGTCESSWILGNRYLQSTYKGNMSGMPFEGWGLMGYDNQKQEFVSMWADNMGTGIAMSDGKADPSGKVFTMMTMMSDPETGKQVPYKMVTKVMDENQYTMSMMSMKDGKEHMEMEITYTRMK
jgi:uncharacterized protein DUF1579